jgi:hypothetical protein
VKQLLGWLLLVGLILAYWKIVVAVIVVVLIVRAFPPAWREHQAQVALRRQGAVEIAARADLEHAWTMQGDPRGMYGRYTPAC